jgi:ribonuclease P/MRP protein subunit POP5
MKDERFRYLAVKIHSEKEIRKEEFVKEMWSSAYSLLGDLGVSKMNLRVVRYDYPFAVIRCSHKSVKMLSAVLGCMKEVDEKEICVQILGISGTIKTATEKFIQKRLLE